MEHYFANLVKDVRSLFAAVSQIGQYLFINLTNSNINIETDEHLIPCGYINGPWFGAPVMVSWKDVELLKKLRVTYCLNNTSLSV